jgi:uncharacterized protein (TIGR03083 family)
MKITPRYDGPPVITLDGDDGPDPGADVARACVRQRERLVATFAGLDDDAWQAPSRCEGWTVQDVAEHLDSVTRYFTLSIGAGLAGEPTRFLDGFDPKATPAELVAAAGSPAPADTLARLTASCAELGALLAGISGDQWSLPAEAPAGHLPVRLVVHHALWDSWVHERDVALPLGLTPGVEPDEMVLSLRYAVALGPAFALSQDLGRPATLVLETTDPDARVVVDVTEKVHVHGGPAPDPTVVVRGRAVDLLEEFSIRAPQSVTVPDEDAWLLNSLAMLFESPHPVA